MFLYEIIIPVFPYSLHTRIGIPANEVEGWMSKLFASESIGLLLSAPIFGYLSDTISNRRIPLICGIFVLSPATNLLLLGNKIWLLLVGRFLQGVAAGIIWVG